MIASKHDFLSQFLFYYHHRYRVAIHATSMDLYLALKKELKLDISHVIKYESYCMSHKYSDINNGFVIHPTLIWASRNVNFSAWLLFYCWTHSKKVFWKTELKYKKYNCSVIISGVVMSLLGKPLKNCMLSSAINLKPTIWCPEMTLEHVPKINFI